MPVHILRHGQPLCGFSSEVPVNWPDGHFFTRKKDKATCPGCKAKANVNLKSRRKETS